MGKFTISKFILVALAVTVVLGLIGCSAPATSITFKMERAAAFNTSGIQRIAVMPFKWDHTNSELYITGLTEYATEIATNRIEKIGKFTLVKSETVESRRRAGQGFDDIVDALFVGEITGVKVKLCETRGKVDGACYAEAYIGFNFSLVKAQDGTVIGHEENRTISYRERYDENTVHTGSADAISRFTISLVRKTIDERLGLSHLLVPYTETKTRTMEKEPDKLLKPQMDSVLVLVEAGNYKAAHDAYIKIYETSKSIAAAINAASVLEALGETQVAADFMQRVITETKNPRAEHKLLMLNFELEKDAKDKERKEVSSDPQTQVASEPVAIEANPGGEAVATPQTNGGTFKTVEINGRTWMAENLNIETPNSWCYDDDASNCEKYGRLYTWETAMKVCPTGWHLPTKEEWEDLATFAGGVSNLDYRRTDNFGFSALPGGNRNGDEHVGIRGRFDMLDVFGDWWTATENGTSNAEFVRINFARGGGFVGGGNKNHGCSVRCVKN